MERITSGKTYQRGKDIYRVHIEGGDGKFYCRFDKNGSAISSGYFSSEQGAKNFMDRVVARYIGEEE